MENNRSVEEKTIEELLSIRLSEIEPRKLENLFANIEKYAGQMPASVKGLFTPHMNYCPLTGEKYETLHEKMKAIEGDPRTDAYRCSCCKMLVGGATPGYQQI